MYLLDKLEAVNVTHTTLLTLTAALFLLVIELDLVLKAGHSWVLLTSSTSVV